MYKVTLSLYKEILFAKFLYISLKSLSLFSSKSSKGSIHVISEFLVKLLSVRLKTVDNPSYEQNVILLVYLNFYFQIYINKYNTLAKYFICI